MIIEPNSKVLIIESIKFLIKLCYPISRFVFSVQLTFQLDFVFFYDFVSIAQCATQIESRLLQLGKAKVEALPTVVQAEKAEVAADQAFLGKF